MRTSRRPSIEGAVQRLRPKLMTVAVVMLSLAPILWESGHRLGRDEANRGANRGRHGDVDDLRPDTGAGVVRDDEGARAAGRASAALGDAPGRRRGKMMPPRGGFLTPMLAVARAATLLCSIRVSGDCE